MSRCSECGTERREFARLVSRRDRRILRAIVGLAAWPWAVHAMVLVLLGIARWQLGRWPGRWGMDDPKGIPVVRSLLLPIDLALISIVPVAMFVLWCLGALAHRRARERALGPRGRIWPLVLLAFGVWASGLAVLRWDPAEAIVWLGD